MTRTNWKLVWCASLLAAGSVIPGTASACGGFFCSQAQPVNQAAERIVFAHNDDGTVTAVIEIMYQGPSESFSWLLPISSVPMGDQIAVASKLSFDRLQSATNPQYSLTTRVEGVCDVQQNFGTGGTASAGGPTGAGGGAGSSGNLDGGGVTVEASGVVGAFEWTVISLDESLPQPADAAVTWLEDNGYDVPEGSAGLLGPYLEDDMYLLALRLQKGADTGSIRPIALTYEATRPMIPIKLTAVAANDDMGVMTWVLGDARAVPQNYYGLELNEARINWFNPSPTYNDVVIAAADEAGGQGFVTEYADDGDQLGEVVWSSFEESSWQAFKASSAASIGNDLVTDAIFAYGFWDGFWDVVRQEVTLPTGVTVESLQTCPGCSYEPFEFIAADFVAGLESNVIVPARMVQELLDTHEHVTRLYTTLSAAEMTVDPLFTFNPSLPTVSNVHSAERVIECGPGYYESTAPWRIELPQGGVVRGGPSDLGTWPASFAELPANRRILRLGESGDGQVLEDNSSDIESAIEAYSDDVPVPPRNPGTPDPVSNPGSPDDIYITPSGGGSGCGCVVAGSRTTGTFGTALLGLLVLFRRRSGRQRPSRPGAPSNAGQG
jgi:hypothetical protein